MNKSKSKHQKSQNHKSNIKKEISSSEIPPNKTVKLKVHKSTRPFGKDITNTFKQSYPYLALNQHLTNKLDNPLPHIQNVSQKKNNSPKKLSNVLSNGISDSIKMFTSTVNTKKINSGMNSINNEKNINRIPYDSNYLKNKIKNSYTQAKITNSSNTTNNLNPNMKSTMTNTTSYMKKINNENINTNNMSSFHYLFFSYMK